MPPWPDSPQPSRAVPRVQLRTAGWTAAAFAVRCCGALVWASQVSALCRPLAFSAAAVVGLRPRRRSRAEVSRRDSAPPARGAVVVGRGSVVGVQPGRRGVAGALLMVVCLRSTPNGGMCDMTRPVLCRSTHGTSAFRPAGSRTHGSLFALRSRPLEWTAVVETGDWALLLGPQPSRTQLTALHGQPARHLPCCPSLPPGSVQTRRVRHRWGRALLARKKVRSELHAGRRAGACGRVGMTKRGATASWPNLALAAEQLLLGRRERAHQLLSRRRTPEGASRKPMTAYCWLVLYAAFTTIKSCKTLASSTPHLLPIQRRAPPSVRRSHRPAQYPTVQSNPEACGLAGKAQSMAESR